MLRSVHPRWVNGPEPASRTRESAPSILKRQSGMASFTCDLLRSITVRTGHTVPSRCAARRSEGLATTCMALQTAPAGKLQTPGEKASAASIFAM